MTHLPSDRGVHSGQPFRVEAPSDSDAIGFALRDAYERDLHLPEDMLAALRRIHRLTQAN